MATHKLAILVSAIGAAKAARDLKGVDKAISNIGGNTGRGLRTAGHNISRLGLIAGGAVVGGLAASAKAAIDWEDAFQGVVKTVEATPKQFEEIGAALREMSTEMPNSALELAAIAEAGGAMGIKAKDIEAFTRQVAILASTTDVSADDAATALGQLQNVVGLTGDEFDNFAAALVDLGNKGASTESEILEIAKRAGGAAKLFGIGKDAILGWSSAAANLGLNSELAGTALQKTFLTLMPKINAGNKTLTSVMGKSATAIRKLFAKDAGKGLELFIKKLAKLPKAARLDAIQKIFGKGSGITRLLLGLTGDVDGLTDSLKDSKDAWAEGSAAQEEFAKRNATVKSAFARLKNGIVDAGVSIGEGFVPALGRAADKLAAFLKVPGNRSALKKLGEDIGKLIDKVDWDGLLSNVKQFAGALEKAGGFTKTLWDSFSALPADVKGIIISLAAVSKLTGGAPIKIAVDFAKGALGGIFGHFFERGSPGNPMWVQQLGGPGGVPVPGGPPKLPPGVVKPAIGAGVVFPIAEFHQQTLIDLQSKGILQGIKDKLPSKPTLKGPTKPGADSPGSQMQGWAEGREAWNATTDATKDVGEKVSKMQGVLDPSILAARDAVHQARDATNTQGAQLKGAVSGGATRTSNATTGGASRITTTSIGNTSRIIAGLRGIQPNVSTDVKVYVTGNTVTKTVTTQTRYGAGTGSAGSNDRIGGKG